MNRIRLIKQWFSLGSICLLCLSTAQAQVNDWTNTFGGKWEDAVNWSLGKAPSYAQSILITNANSKSVLLDAVTTNSPNTMNIGSVTISGSGTTTNMMLMTNLGIATPLQVQDTVNIYSGGALVMSNSVLQSTNMAALGRFTLLDGSLGSFTSLNVGFPADSTGDVLIAGGQLLVSQPIYIGTFGTGQMTVSNGSLNAPWFMIGNCVLSGQQGTLTVAGGVAQFSAAGSGSPLIMAGCGGGSGPQTPSTLWVTGGQLLAPNATLGVYDTAQISISNGLVALHDVYLSTYSGTLTVAGGSLSLAGQLLIGQSYGLSSTIVWVTGGQIVATNSGITAGGGNAGTTVGLSGVTTMIISNGTVLADTVVLSSNLAAQGTITLAGGTMSARSSLVLGYSGCGSVAQFNIAGGNLFVTNPAGTAVLDVRSGTITVSAGNVMIDKLIITNACGHFIHTGGMLVYNQLMLDPNLSAVGDGISNGWKLQYGLDPFDPNLGSADPDGDGMSNLQEYLTGTDPTNSASVFRITGIGLQGNDLLVTWTMGAGKTNALQATMGDPVGSYSNSFTDIFIVTNTVGTVTNYLDLGAPTNFPSRFYRVRLVP